MQRRSADRSSWKRVLERRFDATYVRSPAFTGHITRLLLHRLSEPFYVEIGGGMHCVADSGYSWLQHFPQGAHHTMTTMFDPMGNVVQQYIDICAEHGIGADGVPWFDDLYLDIVVLPSREAVLLDADELDAALQAGQITETEHRLAWEEGHALMEAIKRRQMPLLDLADDHLRRYFPE